MPNLSVVIITFNEERNIARCIDSIEAVADDIVVVDSFSTDKTEEICRLKRVRFVQHEFDGHIEQKIWAITQAKFPHILSLDADEALDEELVKSVMAAKQNWVADGYLMNRLTNYCGKWIRHSSWYPDTKLRLWDSRKGKWHGINPHDKFKMEPGCTYKHLKGNILHYSYYSLQEHSNQINKFTDISAQAYFTQGIKSSPERILISPIIKFFKMFVLHLGFLDGFEGFIIARMSSYATFIKYVKLRQLYISNRKKQT
jgi:glycosyltransferase involved in cell wall biosynthesis